MWLALLQSQHFGSATSLRHTGTLSVAPDCLQGMRYAVDAKANATAYGEGATAEAILSGSVPAPAAFAELYAELDRVGEGAAGSGWVFGS